MVYVFKKLRVLFVASIFLTLAITIRGIKSTQYEGATGTIHFILGFWKVQFPASTPIGDLTKITSSGIFVMVAIALVFHFISRKRYKKLVDILYNDCDPQRFLEKFRPVYAECRRWKPLQKKNSLFIFILYSQGLFEIGDISGAIAVVEEVLHHKSLKSSGNELVKCVVNLSLLRYHYYAEEHPTDFARYLAEIEAICERSPEKNRKIQKQMEGHRRKARALNHLCQGEYEKALALNSDILVNAASNYESTMTRAQLAVIRSSLGDSLKAADHLKHAIQTGPKLFSVLEAKRKIYV